MVPCFCLSLGSPPACKSALCPEQPAVEEPCRRVSLLKAEACQSCSLVRMGVAVSHTEAPALPAYVWKGGPWWQLFTPGLG